MSIRTLLATLLVAAAFCGCESPRVHPIVYPLPAETQDKVNLFWNQLLQSPRNPDRQMILDAIVSAQLHHMGVDRFWFRSEKRFDGGWVVMSSFYDGETKGDGQVTVEVLDHQRMLLSRLTYSDKEVIQTMVDLHMKPIYRTSIVTSEGVVVEAPFKGQTATDQEVEARMKRLNDLLGNDDQE